MITASKARKLTELSKERKANREMALDLAMIEEGIKKACDMMLSVIYYHYLTDETISVLRNQYGYTVQYGEWVIPGKNQTQKCYKISW